MTGMPNTPWNIAQALRREVKTAPAGGTFHNAELSEPSPRHNVRDNKATTFVLIDGSGKAFKVTVSEL